VNRCNDATCRHADPDLPFRPIPPGQPGNQTMQDNGLRLARDPSDVPADRAGPPGLARPHPCPRRSRCCDRPRTSPPTGSGMPPSRHIASPPWHVPRPQGPIRQRDRLAHARQVLAAV